MPDRTALYDQHLALDARMVDFHGWLLPLQYQSILAEHRHCRLHACLFDTGHMGQLLLRGKTAPADLARLLTHDAAALPVGRGRYGFLLNHQAGIIDDTILMRLADHEFLLVTNAATAQTDAQGIQSHLSARTSLTNQSASFGKIDLQGPESFQILRPLLDFDLSRLRYFSVTRATCLDHQCIISRTGYTGELGYELFIPNSDLRHIWDTIVADPRVKPAGLGARDSLRLEMCYPLYGQDITTGTNPLEADLAQFIDLDHDFIGSDAFKDLTAREPQRKLVAFQSASRRRPGTGDQIRRAREKVGAVTSGAFSPSLNISIGLGYVHTACACPATELTAVTTRAELPVTVASKPLYKDGTCRLKKLPPENQP